MRRCKWLILIVLQAAYSTPSLSQALYEIDDLKCQKSRDFLPEHWSGYRLSQFEFICNKNFFQLRASFVSNHESETFLPHYASLKDPIRASSFFSAHNGESPLRGENYLASATTQWEPIPQILYSKIGLSGGLHQSPWTPYYHLPQAYGEVRWKSLIFSVGRKPRFWGQSFVSPLLVSYNATPFDAIELSTLPIKFPGFLKSLGDFRSEVFFSRMNSSREPANDYFLGWRLGWKPVPHFETNVSMLYQFGGDHGYNDSASDFFIEFLGGRPDTDLSTTTGSATNRSAEWDFRIKLVGAWPLSLYAEHHLEDCCGSITGILKYRLSYIYGIAVRTGSDTHDWTLRIEYMKTSNLLNFHGKWPSAISNDGKEVGPYLGRDSQVLSFEIERVVDRFFLKTFRLSSFIQEAARRDRVVFTAGGDPLSLYHADYQKPEQRLGAILDLSFPGFPKFYDKMQTSFGYSRIWNHHYRQNQSAHEWIGRLEFTKVF